MKVNNFSTKLLVLWLPLIILGISIYFIIQGGANGLVVGLVLLGMIISAFTDLRLKGLYGKEDERYHFLLLKGSDVAHRISYSTIIVLIIIHFLFHPLDTGFVLLLLLVVAYASETLGTIYLSYKY